MTPAEYRSALHVLGLDHRTVAEALGCSWRQSYRWSKGETPVPRPVALVLLTCIRNNMFIDQLGAEADQALKALGRADAA